MICFCIYVLVRNSELIQKLFFCLIFPFVRILVLETLNIYVGLLRNLIVLYYKLDTLLSNMSIPMWNFGKMLCRYLGFYLYRLLVFSC